MRVWPRTALPEACVWHYVTVYTSLIICSTVVHWFPTFLPMHPLRHVRMPFPVYKIVKGYILNNMGRHATKHRIILSKMFHVARLPYARYKLMHHYSVDISTCLEITGITAATSAKYRNPSILKISIHQTEIRYFESANRWPKFPLNSGNHKIFP